MDCSNWRDREDCGGISLQFLYAYLFSCIMCWNLLCLLFTTHEMLMMSIYFVKFLILSNADICCEYTIIWNHVCTCLCFWESEYTLYLHFLLLGQMSRWKVKISVSELMVSHISKGNKIRLNNNKNNKE